MTMCGHMRLEAGITAVDSDTCEVTGGPWPHGTTIVLLGRLETDHLLLRQWLPSHLTTFFTRES